MLSIGACDTAFCGGLVEAWSGLEVVAACVSSVAGEETDHVLRRVLGEKLEHDQTRVHWLVPLAQGHGVINQYEPCDGLGSDRYAALVAAHRRQETDWVVVNVGTAVTADMLTAEGVFLGGVIAPGPALMRSALDRGTASVRALEHAARVAQPRNTLAAVGTGIPWALWGVVEGMKREFQRTLGRTPNVLLSGGARHVLAPLLGEGVEQVNELVLEGLAWIARDLGYDA